MEIANVWNYCDESYKCAGQLGGKEHLIPWKYLPIYQKNYPTFLWENPPENCSLLAFTQNFKLFLSQLSLKNIAGYLQLEKTVLFL